MEFDFIIQTYESFFSVLWQSKCERKQNMYQQRIDTDF